MSDIKPLNWTTKTLAFMSYALLRLRSTVHRPPDRFLSCDVRATVLKTFRQGHWMRKSAWRACAVNEYCVTDGVQFVDTTEVHTFRWPSTVCVCVCVCVCKIVDKWSWIRIHALHYINFILLLKEKWNQCVLFKACNPRRGSWNILWLNF